jgi:hypothetical protein
LFSTNTFLEKPKSQKTESKPKAMPIKEKEKKQKKIDFDSW